MLWTQGAGILVSTCDSAPATKIQSAFVGDCEGDQEEINAAIAALPASGGIVLLAEGSYDIRAVPGTLGGILIDRSNVTLRGTGTATKLTLADQQYTNVIRIAGNGTHDVLIEQLQIDANRDANNAAAMGSFEVCGIKARSTGSDPHRNIVVRNTKVFDAHRLNIMLDGIGVKILDNWLGDAGSDVAEILTGPGEISRNYVEISGTTGHGLSSDAASGVTIAGNTVLVLEGAVVTQAVYRTWQAHYHNIFSNNQALVRGEAPLLLWMPGYFNVVQGNVFRAWGSRAKVSINSGATVSGNIFAQTDLEIVDTSGASWPVAVSGNFFFESSLAPTSAAVTQSGNVYSP